MTQSILIVGAGPAAAGAALACAERSVRVTVLDVGGHLEDANAQARGRMAAASPDAWDASDIRTISRLPVASSRKAGLPEKRAYGSDFPFRNFGQLDGLSASTGVNAAVVSGAYGGFSNVWGAQTMPFTAATFRDWPINSAEMDGHYRSVLARIPYAAEVDDLAELFPLKAPSTPLPELSERSHAVLERYARHRDRIRAQGVRLGRARLALNAPQCVRCGLCMTGCPYSLIYSASQTLDELRRDGRITYVGGVLALEVQEGPDGASVGARELSTGRFQRFTADRVLLACGALGTTRLVMSSLRLHRSAATVQESVQFMLPFVSRIPTKDPRRTDDFTLNQFNVVVSLDGDGHDVSQLHFYTYNPAFVQALPRALRGRRTRGLRSQLLRRLSVALGYLPSWASPTFEMRVDESGVTASLPPVTLSGASPGRDQQRFLSEITRRLVRSARPLDLWPVLPKLEISPSGKSYHWGGTFPHATRVSGQFQSDLLGRVKPWERIHLVDASVFPTVPATTFTLTIMANAHRIAQSTIEHLG